MKLRRFVATVVGLTSVVFVLGRIREADMGTPLTATAYVIGMTAWVVFYVWAEDKRWWT